MAGFLCCLLAGRGFAIQESVSLSVKTVDALLSAENRSVFKRDDPKTPELKNEKGNESLSVQAIYGVESNIKVDLTYGDGKFLGRSIGERIGPYEIKSVIGQCVELNIVKPVRLRSRLIRDQEATAFVDRPVKKEMKDKAIQVCWATPTELPMTANSTGLTFSGFGNKSQAPMPPLPPSKPGTSNPMSR
jgi:hypothetical protein